MAMLGEGGKTHCASAAVKVPAASGGLFFKEIEDGVFFLFPPPAVRKARPLEPWVQS